MAGNCSKILFGPKLTSDIPNESFGKFMADSLKLGNQDVALIDAHTGDTLTYEQILQNSIKMAYNLKKNGLKKNDVLAIISENNINYFIPVLATSYLSGIVQFLNAELTLRELSKLLEISKPKWLFCSNNTLASAYQLKYRFSCIETIVSFDTKTRSIKSFEELLETNGEYLENFKPEDVDPKEDVACIFSSSGTTGLPKCVMLTHKNAVASAVLHRCNPYLDFQKGDVTVLPMPFSHVYGYNCLKTALITLTKCIIMKKFIPDLYLNSIAFYKANKICCVPNLLKFIVGSPLVNFYDLSSLKEVTYASAPMQKKTEDAVKKRLNVKLRQGYGATEVSGSCILTPTNLNKPGSCGVLVPGLIAKIAHPETQELLGPNQLGEICIKGPTTMKGYTDNPEATKNSFDKDGFYRTGDIGYYDENEYFFITDRLKEIIKYKGFQVSPKELEDVMMSHPAVADVGVIGIPDERAGEVPLAYVVLTEASAGKTTEKEIVDFVAQHVNRRSRLYGGVRFIKEIPRTNNGKTMRRALKDVFYKITTE